MSFGFSPPRSILGKKTDDGSAVPDSAGEADDGAQACAGSAETAPPVVPTAAPAGEGAGGNQGATDVPPQPRAEEAPVPPQPSPQPAVDQLATSAPQPTPEPNPAPKKQPGGEATRESPAADRDASREVVLHEGEGSRLEGRERKPADPLVFAREVEKDLEVQLSDFKRFHEALKVCLVGYMW